jgi:hypothetical protein
MEQLSSGGWCTLGQSPVEQVCSVGTLPNRQLVNTNMLNLGTMRVLTGWKEISTYLRSGVRTVQRWEILGLPVRRIGGGPRRPVIAFAEELDAWQRAAPTRFLDLIADLKAKVYSLEIELTSLKQQLKKQRHRSSLRNRTKTRYGVAECRRSARQRLLRSAIH